MFPTKQPQSYPDGLTKQTFKDETDINKILQRAQKTGTISHLNQHQARYGDFSDFDYFGAQIMLTKGREIFDDLPSELRTEFRNNPAEFFQYVNDPVNKDRLSELLPGLAAPGRQNISTNNNEGGANAPSEAEPSDQPIPAPQPPAADTTPPTAPNASVEPPAS